jgi:hypothetical protein
MPKKSFVNVKYRETAARINVTNMEDFSELQDAIKTKLSLALAHVDSPNIQLYDEEDQLIEDLGDIAGDYYDKIKEGGISLAIRTSPPGSPQLVLGKSSV